MAESATTGEVSIAPKTTREENRHSASQRQVNKIWEITQAFIAISVTLSSIYAAVNVIESQLLNNSFFLVIGFYFGRNNHQRIGGVELGR